MAGPRGYQTPSHVFYVDDIMIFCRGTTRNLHALIMLLNIYREASGHLISPAKCKFYPGSIPTWWIRNIASLLGFSMGRPPFVYLGVPIFVGKPRRAHLQPLADRIKSKMAKWKGSLLSIMGRVQLVKSIIQGMLVYSFHIYVWPKSLLKSIDTWINNFIWSGDVSTRKLVTVAWHKLCTPTFAGGLGLRSVRKTNDAATLKLCWNFLSSDSQWANFLKACFLKDKHPISYHIKSSIWSGLTGCFNIVFANTA